MIEFCMKNFVYREVFRYYIKQVGVSFLFSIVFDKM